MNTKLLTSAGCLLLLITGVAPSVFGHAENNYNYEDETLIGVTGAFYGSAGTAVINHGIDDPDDDLPDLPDPLAGGAMLCDIEVAGDGTTPFPQDEIFVDGYNDASLTQGVVPDTNDDGGFGGACHVNTYGFEEYNTPGCPSAEFSFSVTEGQYNDEVVGTSAFIGASCDWKTTVGGTPSSDIFLLCVINSVIQGNAVGIVDCLLDLVFCLTAPEPEDACTEGGHEECGSDGSSDAINFGFGSNGVPYPASPYTRDSDGDGDQDATCDPTEFATAATFVFDAVDLGGATPTVFPAGAGQIWQSATVTECQSLTEDDSGTDGGAYPDDPQCVDYFDDDESA